MSIWDTISDGAITVLDVMTPGDLRQTLKLQDTAKKWSEENKDNNEIAKWYNDSQNNWSNILNTPVKMLESGYAALKKYWYIPVVIGGVVIGYKIIKQADTKQLTNAALAALAAKTN